MAKQLDYSFIKDDDVQQAQQCLDFYEGEQLEYLIADLNVYRKRWKQRKFIPRVRNITKRIVDKSGLLFNQPPSLEIVPEPGAKAIIDHTFQSLMERSDWIEFWQNIDVYTRLLKSVCVYVQKHIAVPVETVNGQYVPNFDNGDACFLTMLTRANSDVVLDITGTRVVEVAFLTSPVSKGEFTYRDITADTISDWAVKDEKETLISSMPNPDGFVPAFMVYDVNRPRTGAWCNPPEDLLSLQSMVNLALTDTDLAIAHQKQKTLFTNATVTGTSGRGGSSPTMNLPYADEGFTPAGTSYPIDTMNNTQQDMGGLGEVVTVQSGDPGQQPFIKFDGPTSDLMQLTKVLEDICKQVAEDWSVTLRKDSAGRANSGFQLIVEETDNLQLRDKRGQSFQAAFRRFYEVCKRLYPTLTQGMLRVKFAPPSLPVNTVEDEKMWSDRIAGGRASVMDYLRVVQGLDDATAMEKIQEIIAVNKMLGLSPADTGEHMTNAEQPPTDTGNDTPIAGSGADA